MTKTTHINEIIKRLEYAYPGAEIALHFSNPWELLVATVLSAQCTDVVVNRVTSTLFKKYHSVEDYAAVDITQLETDIKPTGFYHNKAKHIIESAKIVIDKFDGIVPSSMQDLIILPGVARKTANIVLYNAYGIIDGIAVDTHVKRLSRRLGLSHNEDPVKIEKDLMELVPKVRWGSFSYLLIEHGRAVCIARKPKCKDCPLNDICPSVFKD